MNKLPKISAFCPTYGRPGPLEEALQSFLMQDYPGEKELVILNDCPDQHLVFDHQQVRIVNMPSRAPCLIDKYNYSVALCTGDIYTPWDDDDIFLPGRMSAMAANLVDGLFASDLFFVDTDPDCPTLTTHHAACNHAVRKDWFIRFGAYKDSPLGVFDFLMSAYIRQTLKDHGYGPADPGMPTYIYRKFSLDLDHISTHICKEGYYEQYAKDNPPKQTGRIELNPHWSRNWTASAKKAWAKNLAPVPLDEIDKDYRPIGGSGTSPGGPAEETCA